MLCSYYLILGFVDLSTTVIIIVIVNRALFTYAKLFERTCFCGFVMLTRLAMVQCILIHIFFRVAFLIE
jgi:hypothetical protein